MRGMQLANDALAGVAMLDGTLTRLDDALFFGRNVGRLQLYYHRANDQFEWRWRIRRSQHQYIGKGLTTKVLSRLRGDNRARALALDRLLQARVAGRSVRRLIEVIIQKCDAWDDRVLTLRWTDGKGRRLTQWSLLDGGGVRRSTLNQLPPPQFADEIAKLYPVATVPGAGPPDQWLQALVQELQDIDGELMRWQQSMRSASVRLYHNTRSDTWTIRGFRENWKWTSLRLDDESDWQGLMQPVPTMVGNIRAALEQRRRLRRGLCMIKLVTQLAQRWPGGTWSICSHGGLDGKRRRAKTNWTIIAGPRGVLRRTYRSAAPVADDQAAGATV